MACAIGLTVGGTLQLDVVTVTVCEVFLRCHIVNTITFPFDEKK